MVHTMLPLPSLLSQPLNQLSSLFVANLPTHRLHQFIVHLVKLKSKSLSSDDGLRLLFNIDASLYPLKGQLAIAYDNGIHTKHRHIRYHDFFVDRIKPGERVLDIGCGSGELAYDIAEKTRAKVVAIDINPINIEKAKQNYTRSNIEYHTGNALIDLPEKEFDVVILSNVLEHLPERSQFLLKIQEKLKPSRFLLRVPLFERDWQVPLKKELGLEWRLDPTHYTEYTLETYIDEVSSANLQLVHHEIRWSEIWSEAIPYAS